MAISTTTLTAAITNNKLFNIAVASAAAFGANQPVKIDGEYMWCVSANVAASTITVRSRGSEGSLAAPHDVNAVVMTAPTAADFPTVAPAGNSLIDPAGADDIITLGQDQTVNVPPRNTTYQIAKTSAAAITINPVLSAAQVGTQMVFISATAFAHVITFEPGFLGTVSGTNDDLNFAASVGASCVVEVGSGGQLIVLSLNNVTIG